MILLYTGLRPNELKTAKIDGLFIVAQNSKRKNKKVVYKKIPIIDALKPYLSESLRFSQPYTLREHLKKVLPNHILYDLRTTFYTRCDEFGVTAIARDEFVGHSNGALTNAYRNLSDEYLIEQAKKLNKWI
jgi:integrase